MTKKFKNRAGLKPVTRPNSTAATGSAPRYMRVVPAESGNGPAAGPATRPALMTANLYFADDEAGQLFEANLVAAVLESKDAFRHAELKLASYFADAALTLRAERIGFARRADSRVDAPPELFISLEARYSLQASEIRERQSYISLEAYDDEPRIRAAAAAAPTATIAELTLLAHDNDPAVSSVARHILESRAE